MAKAVQIKKLIKTLNSNFLDNYKYNNNEIKESQDSQFDNENHSDKTKDLNISSNDYATYYEILILGLGLYYLVCCDPVSDLVGSIKIFLELKKFIYFYKFRIYGNTQLQATYIFQVYNGTQSELGCQIY